MAKRAKNSADNTKSPPFKTDVKMGLRRVLLTQTRRMTRLAEKRFKALGGENLVETGYEDEDEDDAKGD